MIGSDLFGLPNFIFFLVTWVPGVCYICSKHKESYCYYCSHGLEFWMVQLQKQLPFLVMRLKNSCYSCKILWSWYCFSGCFNNIYHLLIILNHPYYSSKCNISLWCWTFRNWVIIYVGKIAVSAYQTFTCIVNSAWSKDQYSATVKQINGLFFLQRLGKLSRGTCLNNNNIVIFKNDLECLKFCNFFFHFHIIL